MASENLQRWWPSLGSLDVPRCRKCRVPRVPRVPSSLPLCPLQIMPAPPNVALQLPHFGRVPSTTSTTTFKNIQKHSKKLRTKSEATAENVNVADVLPDLLYLFHLFSYVFWAKCMQMLEHLCSGSGIRAMWPPGAKATKALACATGQAMTCGSRHFKRFQALPWIGPIGPMIINDFQWFSMIINDYQWLSMIGMLRQCPDMNGSKWSAPKLWNLQAWLPQKSLRCSWMLLGRTVWSTLKLVGGWATPLKNISQLGWWHSQYMGK